MLPVSARFLAALRASHQPAMRVRVITPGATGADPPGTDLRVMDGSVTLDASADVRGTLDLTVADGWPDGGSVTELAPYGTELAVSRGVVFGNGDVERAPLGIYRVVSVEQGDAPAGALRVTAADRMSGIIDAKLTVPRQFLASATYGDVVDDLVGEVYPGVPVEWDDATDAGTLGRTTIVEADRHGFLKDLAAALGKVMYFDYRGALVIKDPPDPTVPVWDVDAGATGVLVAVGRARTREGVRNAVVATGDALDDFAPATAVVVDDDPASVTYWDGDFGKVPERFSSPLIFTLAQATAAAAAQLVQLKGLPYSVDFTAVPNPALEPLDAVRVVYPPRRDLPPRPRLVEVHVLEQLRIPLAPAAALTAATRLQTTGGLG